MDGWMMFNGMVSDLLEDVLMGTHATMVQCRHSIYNALLIH